MFTPIDEYSARDRDGTEVRLSREFVSYMRNDRAAHFEYEYLILEDAILIYSSSIRAWDTARGGAIITSTEREAILKDLEAAFEALGIKHRVDL